MSSHTPRSTPPRTTSTTPVGVDVGSTGQLFAATTIDDGPAHATTPSADYAEALFGEFQTATSRLGIAPAAGPDNLGAIVARYWERLRTAFELAADDVIRRARTHSRPVLVLEDLPTGTRPLAEAANGGVRWATYCPPVAQQVLAERAISDGVPVAYVDPMNTTQECHACGELGDVDRYVIECRNDDCHVEAAGRDPSAAVSIAKRFGHSDR